MKLTRRGLLRALPALPFIGNLFTKPTPAIAAATPDSTDINPPPPIQLPPDYDVFLASGMDIYCGPYTATLHSVADIEAGQPVSVNRHGHVVPVSPKHYLDVGIALEPLKKGKTGLVKLY